MRHKCFSLGLWASFSFHRRVVRENFMGQEWFLMLLFVVDDDDVVVISFFIVFNFSLCLTLTQR